MTQRILHEIATKAAALDTGQRRLALRLISEIGLKGATAPKSTLKSRQRLRIEALRSGPTAGKTSFSYGSFDSPKALDALCRTVGGAGWYSIQGTATAQVVTKVK